MRKWIGFTLLVAALAFAASRPAVGQQLARLFGTSSTGAAEPIKSSNGALYVTSGGITGAQTLKTGTTANDTLLLQAYDVDGAAYTTLLTLTAANAPYLQIGTSGTATLKVHGTSDHTYLENTSTGGLHFITASGATSAFYQTGLSGYNAIRAAGLFVADATYGGVFFDTANTGTIGKDGLLQPASVWVRTSLNVQTANAATISIKQATTSITCSSGATCTATNLIPAGAMVVGVTTRVTTLVTGATTFDIGDGSTADLFGDDEAVAANSTTGLADHKATWTGPKLYAAATNVVLTANGGNFSAGVVRITVHYMSLSAASS